MTDPNDARSRSGYGPIPEPPRPEPSAPQPYPQSPYPPQPYPQAPYSAQPYPPQPYPQPTGRSRRLSLVWAGVGLVAAVGVGLGAGVLAVPSDPSPQPVGVRRVAAPASFGPYEQVRGADGRRVVQRVRDAVTTSDPRAAVFRGAVVGLYQRAPGSSRILFLANDTHHPGLRRIIQEASPSQDTLDFLAGSGSTDIREFPAGPLGGSLRCGGPGKIPYSACAWVDDSSLGWVVDYGGRAPEKLAGLARTLRGAAEH